MGSCFIKHAENSINSDHRFDWACRHLIRPPWLDENIAVRANCFLACGDHLKSQTLHYGEDGKRKNEWGRKKRRVGGEKEEGKKERKKKARGNSRKGRMAHDTMSGHKAGCKWTRAIFLTSGILLPLVPLRLQASPLQHPTPHNPPPTPTPHSPRSSIK